MSDFQEFGERFKKQKAAEKTSGIPLRDPNAVYDHDQSYLLRGKMLGVLLRDARVNADRKIGDVVDYLHVTPEDVEAWEFGDSSPSLPQLELLAYFFDVPVSHFWGVKTLASERSRPVSAQEEFAALRNRMIGALLRQSREEMKSSIEDLAERTALSPQELHDYELGEVPVPMHTLVVLANAVQKSMGYFLETSSQIGDLLSMREKWKHFNTLPEELREFAANPQNIGFIEIALNFSRMNSDVLRRIAVSMLDITGY
jgi:transcriptional regulator with XRE-family HTH domain